MIELSVNHQVTVNAEAHPSFSVHDPEIQGSSFRSPPVPRLYLTQAQLQKIPGTSNFSPLYCGSQKSMFKGLAKANLKREETHTTLIKPRSWWAEINSWNHNLHALSACWKKSAHCDTSQECKTINVLIIFFLFCLSNLSEVIPPTSCNFLFY